MTGFDPLAEWNRCIDDRGSFLAEPDQYRQRLMVLARAALDGGQVSEEEFGEMLELLDCAKIWAEVELAEAEGIGLFVGRTPGTIAGGDNSGTVDVPNNDER
ncbi:hypothetical protein C4C37_13545 [Pseudomonas amygdali pv. lachrymans]|uniref:Uncharacterized protein n=1 Tax=Pseudomonas amygdali pv. lachrymans str. M301315 TaxID=629260 RepID=A0AAD0LYJ4_PSEAV|nr:hypothetical protein [Pseudomonas amygdali]AXH56332.1 hypothetical protein PLA107_014175 [Pseudomonas amygdali pv. lachrymans str. M301315]PWD04058.1 hypothetical protein CX658_03650 [Pseudomonas amygdali pv. lachrymans]QWA52591.1 hypothetical protein C4C37_13545 [Pseudomonas amygdali pv. lachrymans]RMT09556.1 putative prophage PSSB64-02, Orf2 [Pseudomonas amygdali pv. lachrymans]